MQTNEKARSDVAASERAKEETSEVLFSYKQNITESGQIQGQIAALLPRGEENALPMLESP